MQGLFCMLACLSIAGGIISSILTIIALLIAGVIHGGEPDDDAK